MIKNYIKHYYKEMIWIYLAIVGMIYFLLYACYNMPTYANYHDYGFTYLFSIAMLCIIIFGTRYQYKEFSKACIQCQEMFKAEKEFYDHMVFDDFVYKLYDDGEFNMDLLGCPKEYNDDQAKQWLKNYIKTLVKEDNQ